MSSYLRQRNSMACGKVGFRTNKVYGENTTCHEMEVWRLSL
ncbi:hypothetical protein [Prevotella sp. OH937_COT-195]|nr:hypothetical protein [Prevotella sp. OH937_COT-195]